MLLYFLNFKLVPLKVNVLMCTMVCFSNGSRGVVLQILFDAGALDRGIRSAAAEVLGADCACAATPTFRSPDAPRGVGRFPWQVLHFTVALECVFVNIRIKSGSSVRT